jgi:hypothetical protein
MNEKATEREREREREKSNQKLSSLRQPSQNTTKNSK